MIKKTINHLSLIPAPKECLVFEGEYLLHDKTTISYEGYESLEIAFLLSEYLQVATGYSFPVIRGIQGDITLIQTKPSESDHAGFHREEYELQINSEGILISASQSEGLARAIQTIRQLLPEQIFSKDLVKNTKWSLPIAHIHDEPRFRWRGLHLDVSRHCFPMSELKDHIDLLALHKYNIFHLHLTDDQGWRMEIKKYPKLTEIGASRDCTLLGHENDRPRKYNQEPYHGHYTQNELQELVEYARKRRITIIPEIDMPGHMQAAISAYPELGNTDQSIKPRCHWGISTHILNAEDETVQFMKNVLDEVMAIFPSKFIHIGGDEVEKLEWMESRRIQDRMKELGLASENELQGWFLNKMADHIISAGRRVIGWDEILDGGIPKDVAVMSWRNEEGGKVASSEGHDVVMAPSQSTYFDHYQSKPINEEPLAIGGMISLGDVYSYDPIPKEMLNDQTLHVLGAQGQVWTEYMPDMDQVEYMAFPRACALAEVLWLEGNHKNFPDFERRLLAHQRKLSVLGVRFHSKSSL